MFQPWVAHYYPGITPANIDELRWSQYIAMWDATKAS